MVTEGADPPRNGAPYWFKFSPWRGASTHVLSVARRSPEIAIAGALSRHLARKLRVPNTKGGEE